MNSATKLIFLCGKMARTLELRLVTNNTAEFGRVKGLTLENWTLPVRRTRPRGEE